MKMENKLFIHSFIPAMEKALAPLYVDGSNYAHVLLLCFYYVFQVLMNRPLLTYWLVAPMMKDKQLEKCTKNNIDG